MFALVAIGIVGVCLLIDIASGDFARAASAWTILGIIVLFLIGVVIKDSEDKKAQKRKEEARLEAAKHADIPLKVARLKRRFPGHTEEWYIEKANQYPLWEIWNCPE